MSFQNNEYIRVEKIGTVKDPWVPTPKMEDITPGEIHDGVSLPVEYTLTGIAPVPPQEGKRFTVLRDTRNGIEMPGIFETTPITKVTKVLGDLETCFEIETMNSKYRITIIPPPERAFSGES